MAKKTGDTTRTHKPMVVTIELDSGVRVDIRPLPLATMRLIQDKGAELYPYPDKSDYEVSLGEDVAAHSHVTLPAEENEEYRRLFSAAQEERAQYLHRRLLIHSIQFPDFDGHDDIIAYFRPMLELLAEDGLLELATDPDELWWQVYLHGVIASPEDQALIALAAQNALPITEDEEREALRSFRPKVSRDTVRRSLRAANTPDIQTRTNNT